MIIQNNILKTDILRLHDILKEYIINFDLPFDILYSLEIKEESKFSRIKFTFENLKHGCNSQLSIYISEIIEKFERNKEKLKIEWSYKRTCNVLEIRQKKFICQTSKLNYFIT